MPTGDRHHKHTGRGWGWGWREPLPCCFLISDSLLYSCQCVSFLPQSFSPGEPSLYDPHRQPYVFFKNRSPLGRRGPNSHAAGERLAVGLPHPERRNRCSLLSGRPPGSAAGRAEPAVLDSGGPHGHLGRLSWLLMEGPWEVPDWVTAASRTAIESSFEASVRENTLGSR